MTFIPSLAISLTALGIIALLVVVDWFVSGFSVGVPTNHPGEPHPDVEPGEFREVA